MQLLIGVIYRKVYISSAEKNFMEREYRIATLADYNLVDRVLQSLGFEKCIINTTKSRGIPKPAREFSHPSLISRVAVSVRTAELLNEHEEAGGEPRNPNLIIYHLPLADSCDDSGIYCLGGLINEEDALAQAFREIHKRLSDRIRTVGYTFSVGENGQRKYSSL